MEVLNAVPASGSVTMGGYSYFRYEVLTLAELLASVCFVMAKHGAG